jgi:hypothetical protein
VKVIDIRGIVKNIAEKICRVSNGPFTSLGSNFVRKAKASISIAKENSRYLEGL